MPVPDIPDRSPDPDAALVRAARLGDPAAFEAIVIKHGPSMHRFAVRMLANQTDAADVVQEAFVSASKDLKSFAGNSALRTWLMTLTARRAADLQRRRQPLPMEEHTITAALQVASEDPLQNVLDAELVTALRRVLLGLPWRQRMVWLLREIEEMSYQEIATALSMGKDSVRGHLQRARRAVTEGMTPWR